MHLSAIEKSLLEGETGTAAKKAMEILVALGKIFHAQDMVEVSSAQIAGVSYQNIGDPGIEFLTHWVELDAAVRIPAFMNPAGIDRNQWKQMGFSESFAVKQLEIISLLQKMGIAPTLSCTPYHLGHTPTIHEHVAWSESSAVSYANSVLGARTNREGGPSALAAAITGRTPRFGLHLQENRRATHRIDVKCKLTHASEFGLIGYLVGKAVGNGIPYFCTLTLPEGEIDRTSALKTLGAAMAASGAVALYHVHDFTPELLEAPDAVISSDLPVVAIDSIEQAIASLRQQGTQLDLVALGCPHSSIEQIREIAEFIGDRTCKAKLWITTSAAVRTIAASSGLIDQLNHAGVNVIADTCMVVAPLQSLDIKYVGVDSAKAACYLPSHQGMTTYWGTTEQCIESAIEGQWKF
ncbi:aconitase X catalytic domain-containing protein [candidate division KSB1 bacterium]|nr:aconitase X catalytic domain-containing protein [candidate division KSB1 bacterium]